MHAGGEDTRADGVGRFWRNSSSGHRWPIIRAYDRGIDDQRFECPPRRRHDAPAVDRTTRNLGPSVCGAARTRGRPGHVARARARLGARDTRGPGRRPRGSRGAGVRGGDAVRTAGGGRRPPPAAAGTRRHDLRGDRHTASRARPARVRQAAAAGSVRDSADPRRRAHARPGAQPRRDRRGIRVRLAAQPIRRADRARIAGTGTGRLGGRAGGGDGGARRRRRSRAHRRERVRCSDRRRRHTRGVRLHRRLGDADGATAAAGDRRGRAAVRSCPARSAASVECRPERPTAS